jgi:hypothetical protein
LSNAIHNKNKETIGGASSKDVSKKKLELAAESLKRNQRL